MARFKVLVTFVERGGGSLWSTWCVIFCSVGGGVMEKEEEKGGGSLSSEADGWSMTRWCWPGSMCCSG
uniref:Uncharacterized protein n=1 Tax=Knipowitschia caucasica TaxID=637954 RepID=A0AAV2IRC6_KNICA